MSLGSSTQSERPKRLRNGMGFGDRCCRRIGFFIPNISLVKVISFCVVCLLGAGELCLCQSWQVHPSWYDTSSKQVDWDKYPSGISSVTDSFPVLSRWQWGVCYAADVRGNTAYIGNGDLFQVLDLSDPSNPLVIGEIPLGAVSVISIKDSIAHVLGSRYYTVDISDPYHPKKLGELFLPWPMRVVPTDTFSYVSYFGGLAIVDYSDPTNLTVRNSTGVPGEFPVGLAV